MTDSALRTADVVVDPRLPRAPEALLTEALTCLGLTPRVRELPRRRSPDQLAWMVMVTVPLHGFLKALADKSATDAYERLQKAVRGLRKRTEEQPRPLVLQDPESSLRIVLDPDLPPEAYRQLLSLDLTGYRLGPLRYDTTHSRWRSELDEVEPH
ncbi:hypothetical protein [Streptomyces cyanogenus]|uniref:Uncharacterized protein n=1 Tax=Streptomyces cyanogenus TaxID=80860 RepID=A0ABX7U2C8_STRCY|nr:hypothetical protein [Streptomyces cyanogenus]QTE02922.1 hypothetical protein S1361_36650 [Streptomyces cyanogenus]